MRELCPLSDDLREKVFSVVFVTVFPSFKRQGMFTKLPLQNEAVLIPKVWGFVCLFPS